MKHLAATIGVLAAAAMLLSADAGGAAEQTESAQGGSDAAVRFMPVEVYVDPRGTPLAAYQFTLQAEPFRGASDADEPRVRIVGLEGGEHEAFAEPPYYDPAAIQGERVIAAAFSLNDAEALPDERTRVATVHVAVRGTQEPAFDVVLNATADHEGTSIDADIEIEPKGERDG